jgi:hypothetical protein
VHTARPGDQAAKSIRDELESRKSPTMNGFVAFIDLCECGILGFAKLPTVGG